MLKRSHYIRIVKFKNVAMLNESDKIHFCECRDTYLAEPCPVCTPATWKGNVNSDRPLILWDLGVPHRGSFVVPVQQHEKFGWIVFDQELSTRKSFQIFPNPYASVAAGIAALDEFLSEG